MTDESKSNPMADRELIRPYSEPSLIMEGAEDLTPQIGARVYFWPERAPADIDTQLDMAMLDRGLPAHPDASYYETREPLIAIITKVHNERKVSALVLHPCGHPLGGVTCRLRQPGDHRPKWAPFCEFPPEYFVYVGKGTEAQEPEGPQTQTGSDVSSDQ